MARYGTSAVSEEEEAAKLAYLQQMAEQSRAAYMPAQRTQEEMAAALRRDTDTTNLTGAQRHEDTKLGGRGLLGMVVAPLINKMQKEKRSAGFAAEDLQGLTNARAAQEAQQQRAGLQKSKEKIFESTQAYDKEIRGYGESFAKQEDQQESRIVAAKLLADKKLEDEAHKEGVEVMYLPNGTPVSVQRNAKGEYFYAGSDTSADVQGLDKVNPSLRGNAREKEIRTQKVALGKEMEPLLKLVRSTTELSSIFAEGGYDADTAGIGFIEGGENVVARGARLAGVFGKDAQRNNRRLFEVRNEVVKQGAGLAQTLSEVANQTKALGADDLNDESTLRDGVWSLQQRLNMELDLIQNKYGKDVLNAYLAEMPEDVQSMLTDRFTGSLVAGQSDAEGAGESIDDLLSIY